MADTICYPYSDRGSATQTTVGSLGDGREVMKPTCWDGH